MMVNLKMKNSQKDVIPAEAGIYERLTSGKYWIPVFTGMTNRDEIRLFAKLSKMKGGES